METQLQQVLEKTFVRMDLLSRLQLATEMMAMQTIAMAVQAPELLRLDGLVHLEVQQLQVHEKILEEMERSCQRVQLLPTEMMVALSMEMDATQHALLRLNGHVQVETQLQQAHVVTFVEMDLL